MYLKILTQQNTQHQLRQTFQYKVLQTELVQRHTTHEDGTDQVANGTTTAIQAFITSGDLDIDDGEFFSSIRRFVPDYKYITGNSKVTLFINDYPNNAKEVHLLDLLLLRLQQTK